MTAPRQSVAAPTATNLNLLALFRPGLPIVGGTPLAANAATHTHAGAAGGLTSSSHRPPEERSPLPLVPTITRFINVIPEALWIVLGGLVMLALALAVNSRLTGARANRLVRQRAELLEDVGLLQAALLPRLPSSVGAAATSAAYRPADGPGAGGDFYDLFGLEDGRLAIVVGDLSGHGRQALPHTALVRFTLRAYLEAGMAPRHAIQTAGAVLDRQLDGSFVTVVVAVYDPGSRTLTYACAGHPPPIVLPAPARAASPVPAAPPIGAGVTTGTRQTVVSMPGHTLVCFYTDGILDAKVGDDRFGVARLERTLAELPRSEGAEELLERIALETDQRPDDMAACLLGLDGPEVEPTVVHEEHEPAAGKPAGGSR